MPWAPCPKKSSWGYPNLDTFRDEEMVRYFLFDAVFGCVVTTCQGRDCSCVARFMRGMRAIRMFFLKVYGTSRSRILASHVLYIFSSLDNLMGGQGSWHSLYTPLPKFSMPVILLCKIHTKPKLFLRSNKPLCFYGILHECRRIYLQIALMPNADGGFQAWLAVELPSLYPERGTHSPVNRRISRYHIIRLEYFSSMATVNW